MASFADRICFVHVSGYTFSFVLAGPFPKVTARIYRVLAANASGASCPGYMYIYDS